MRKRKHLFGSNGDTEGRVEGGRDGGRSGVVGAEGDEAAAVDVDAGAGDGAVYLQAGLQLQHGAVSGEAGDQDDGGRGGGSCLGGLSLSRFGRRRPSKALGEGSGERIRFGPLALPPSLHDCCRRPLSCPSLSPLPRRRQRSRNLRSQANTKSDSARNAVSI
ncbi:hypothetical protein MUK42_36558 [Musa troglodytarum]|uniref:Uncharacterized protein n=1 Tax=Musa troglodytarum TaxID=320322 RepID=A0A9E7F5Y3_9LILI|nr:hypothetical protein MUK42_36558 [Musa troglodytarum]